MSKLLKDYWPETDGAPVMGFDVTVEHVVGRVEFGDGTESPRVAAFKLIAQYGDDGVFRFPTEAGWTCKVTVETVQPDTEAKVMTKVQWPDPTIEVYKTIDELIQVICF